MKNRQVAAIFAAMADTLAIQGEDYHRIMAYRRAAENVASLGQPLEATWQAGELEEIPGIGKTLVSSSMIDRVAAGIDRRLVEVPVGFKWFVDGLMDGSLGFGGEESAGASFLDKQGGAWSTDKDGLILGLLAAEITAVTGKDPSERYQALRGFRYGCRPGRPPERTPGRPGG